jgi:hypothetical protein
MSRRIPGPRRPERWSLTSDRYESNVHLTGRFVRVPRYSVNISGMAATRKNRRRRFVRRKVCSKSCTPGLMPSSAYQSAAESWQPVRPAIDGEGLWTNHHPNRADTLLTD